MKSKKMSHLFLPRFIMTLILQSVLCTSLWMVQLAITMFFDKNEICHPFFTAPFTFSAEAKFE
jgi:hypothetical protein